VTTKYKLLNADGVQVGQSDDGKVWEDMAEEPAEMFTFTETITQGTIIVSDGDEVTATALIENKGLQAGEYTISGTNVLDAAGNVIGKYNETEKGDETICTVSDLAGNVLVSFSEAVTEFTVGGVNVSSQAAANKAITTINNALEKVSAERSKLGAYQNRLEHTINNLGASAENLTAAESRIRDVDMAKEMMEFTRANILSQAAQAMLAQANQLPQGVLQLLR
ncbi:MAG: flagellin, partial [Bacillota bacterium]